MSYELFMLWLSVFQALWASSMVLGGLLCVWCAFISRKRTRLASNCVRQLSHQ
jgi:hypothetical protein